MGWRWCRWCRQLYDCLCYLLFGFIYCCFLLAYCWVLVWLLLYELLGKLNPKVYDRLELAVWNDTVKPGAIKLWDQVVKLWKIVVKLWKAVWRHPIKVWDITVFFISNVILNGSDILSDGMTAYTLSKHYATTMLGKNFFSVK